MLHYLSTYWNQQRGRARLGKWSVHIVLSLCPLILQVRALAHTAGEEMQKFTRKKYDWSLGRLAGKVNHVTLIYRSGQPTSANHDSRLALGLQ